MDSKKLLAQDRSNSQGIWKMFFARDGKSLLTAGTGKPLLIRDPATGREIGSFPLAGKASPQSLSISPDGKLIAAGLDDGRIVLWDFPSRRPLLPLPGHANAVSSLCFSRNGLTLASGGRDQVIKLWDVATGQLKTTLEGHTGNVMELAFTPDDRTLASASLDHTVRLWRTASPGDPAQRAKTP